MTWIFKVVGLEPPSFGRGGGVLSTYSNTLKQFNILFTVINLIQIDAS